MNYLIVQLIKFYHRFQLSTNMIEIKGKKILIFPKVLAPTQAVISSQFFIENLLVKKSDEVLDLGTGSGILSIFCAEKVKKIIATDINPYAIKLAKKNFELNNISNAEVRLGDLFNPIKEKFDLIIFNPPYIPKNTSSKNLIELALCCGTNYELIRKFATKSKKYLKPNGRILIIFSNLADLEIIKSIFIKENYNLQVVARKKFLFEKFVIYLLTLKDRS